MSIAEGASVQVVRAAGAVPLHGASTARLRVTAGCQDDALRVGAFFPAALGLMQVLRGQADMWW